MAAKATISKPKGLGDSLIAVFDNAIDGQVGH